MKKRPIKRGNEHDVNPVEIVFQPHGKRAKFPPGTTIFEAAKAMGVDISTLCGGRGLCGKCKVRVEERRDRLPPFTDKELEHLSKEEMEGYFRLSCQVPLMIPSVIFVPERSRLGKQRLQTEGFEVPVKPRPLVRKYFIRLPPPSLHDARSDEDRVLHALQTEYGLQLSSLEIDFNVARGFSTTIREANWAVTAVIWKNKIIDIEPGNTTNRCFGFAIDIGTSKLAGFLMDLNSGSTVEVAAKMNPQHPLGEDVMSRITYAVTGGRRALEELQGAVISGINEMIEECCERVAVKPEEIYELNFAGNTCMQLLFLGLWPQYVALSPYTAVLRRGVDISASRLGLRSHANANAHFLPIIGGFVGADNVAVILATGMLESDEIIMAMDIGTNTEIDIGNKDLVMVDSCASGPAFEGMHIKFGMRAATGAIERISIDPNTLEVTYRTIEDAPPVGMCGSALIDALAELLKSGIIDLKGKFVTGMTEKTERLRQGSEGYEFVVAWKAETAIATDVVVTQGDIRELQKAKAAMHTGATILMKQMDITEKDISKLVLAGAFGNYIDPENARMIGMYPEFPIERIEFIGNAAGTGSRMCLISKEMRERSETISRKVKYYELAADPDFQTEYLNSMYLPHADLNKYPITKELLHRLGRIS